MKNSPDLKPLVRQFIDSDERVLMLPFDGQKEDVSAHWHHFLRSTPWQLTKKSLVTLATRYLPSGPLKNRLLRSIGVKVGKNVFIASMVQLDIQYPELITIEDGAILGMYSHVSTHEVTHSHIRLGKVRIGKNALIGAQATVRSGVNVGDEAVVAMRAFVTHDVAPGTLVTGVPDRKVVELETAL